MIPALYIPMDDMPLTPNGKVDRGRLPPPQWGPAATTRRIPPRTPLEEALAVVWAELLGVNGIGVRDDFFELGGQSLLVTPYENHRGAFSS